MPTKKKITARRPRKTFHRVNLRVPLADYREWIKAARKVTHGNISAWVRHATTRYRPRVGERVIARSRRVA